MISATPSRLYGETSPQINRLKIDLPLKISIDFTDVIDSLFYLDNAIACFAHCLVLRIRDAPARNASAMDISLRSALTAG
ncbi:MAG: hypothetical protein ACRC7H_07530, partial [Plesiomonas shigelloides]